MILDDPQIVVNACAVDQVRPSTFVPSPGIIDAMASVLGKMLFGLVMLVVGGMIALLVIVLEMITHPFTVFKKVPRNGELT